MKKMLILLAILSSITIKCEKSVENAYDFQRDLKKFKEKYENQDFTSHRLYQKEPLALHQRSGSLNFIFGPSREPETWEQEQNKAIIHQWPQNRKDLIQYLEKHGSEAINQEYGTDFNSPMYGAIRSNDFAFVKFLLEHGGSLDYSIGCARTLEMVKYLEENGADLNLSEATIKYEIKNDDIRKYLENKKEAFNKQNQLLDAKIQK